MNASHYFKLGINGHKDIDFVDISLDSDIKLFLDPSLIQGTQTEWCQRCHRKMDSFFTKAFDICKEKDDHALYEILQFGHEPNETKLGLSQNQSRGKGTGPDALYQIFRGLDSKVLGTPEGIFYPSDLCVVVKNFAEDRMSDLTTNIIRKELYEFTVQQCEKHNIPLALDEVDLGATWNADTEQWERFSGRPLIANGRVILLVPKNIVRHYYVYGTEQYISQYVIPIRQQYHRDNRTSLALKYSKKHGEYYGKPFKKDIRKAEIHGNRTKVYAQRYMAQDPDSIINFRETMMAHTAAGQYCLMDAYLDYLAYRRAKQIS